MFFRNDEDLAPPREGENDTARIWVSDQQWLAIMDRAERSEPLSVRHDTSDRRDESRSDIQCKCVLRWGGDRAPDGTYLVRTHDLSSGGVRFTSADYIEPRTRCTLALQPEGLGGLLVAGRVAWCRPVELVDDALEAFEVGVQFDRPIDLDGIKSVA